MVGTTGFGAADAGASGANAPVLSPVPTLFGAGIVGDRAFTPQVEQASLPAKLRGEPSPLQIALVFAVLADCFPIINQGAAVPIQPGKTKKFQMSQHAHHMMGRRGHPGKFDHRGF